MGHTRMTTQGNENRNYNNHPFLGQTREGAFALTHNGVIQNDRSLRKKLRIPKNRIETDSYVAVQLLEREGALNFDSLRRLASSWRAPIPLHCWGQNRNCISSRGTTPCVSTITQVRDFTCMRLLRIF